jgi:hypothetical protein
VECPQAVAAVRPAHVARLEAAAAGNKDYVSRSPGDKKALNIQHSYIMDIR